jgi:hypothetical protein
MTTINYAYPSTRRRGPFQSVPKPAHKPSASMSSIGSSIASGSCASHSTCASQDIVARILAQDEIPRGTFVASEAQNKKQTHGKSYPDRLDSRRAMLSVFNGSKAPIVFKGPSFRVDREVDIDPILPTRRSTAAYLHKDLPPTPKSASSRSPVLSQSMSSSNTLPPVRPLNLSIKRSPAERQPKDVIPNQSTITKVTLAPKRISRAVRAVPAPIRPPPRLRGITALNGPSSDAAKDEEEKGRGIKTQALRVGTTRVLGQEDVLPENTPIGDLPITPLDIPVDWDDLNGCWTSPVLDYPEEEGEKKESKGFGMDVDDQVALRTFQREVEGLFATSPNGEEGEPLELSSGTPSPCSEASVTRQKRHGRMLVTKQLKLCMDASVQFDKHLKSHRASTGRQYKAGESFLMMTSPLTPCGASAGLRTSSLLDGYSYVS